VIVEVMALKCPLLLAWDWFFLDDGVVVRLSVPTALVGWRDGKLFGVWACILPLGWILRLGRSILEL
jgi:hypothetical protein